MAAEAGIFESERARLSIQQGSEHRKLRHRPGNIRMDACSKLDSRRTRLRVGVPVQLARKSPERLLGCLSKRQIRGIQEHELLFDTDREAPLGRASPADPPLPIGRTLSPAPGPGRSVQICT